MTPSRVPPRADAVLRYADLRSTDRVLDVGCGEGEVALRVAPAVRHVHGFDVSPERVARATRHAAEQKIANATFETSAIQDFPFERKTWDVALFMRVWGKKTGGERRVGFDELTLILPATRRQLVMVAGKHLDEDLPEMLDVFDDFGFDGLCFTRPDLILANRREADVRLGELPPLAIVPSAWARDRSFGSGSSTANDHLKPGLFLGALR